MKSQQCRIQWEINSLYYPNKLLRCTYIKENVEVLGPDYLPPSIYTYKHRYLPMSRKVKPKINP